MTQLSPFMLHALTMTGGSALAQFIPLAVMPLLSRLYSPAEFGLLATIVALSAVVSIASTGRYELAVVLPKEDEEANALVVLALGLAVATCTIVLTGVGLVVAGIVPVERLRSVGGWLLAVPLLAFLMAAGQIGSFINNRDRAYGTIAAASVAQQLVNAGIAIALGVSRALAGGLVIARTAGALSYVVGYHAGLRRALRHRSAAKAWACAKTYRQFLFFNVPYSLLCSISKYLLIFVLTLKGEIVAAGLFGMSRTLMLAPVSLLSDALSQVFYKETVVSIGSPEHKQLTIKLLKATALAFVPAFALVGWWAPEVFAVLLGEPWREAGVFAAVLAFPYALNTLTGWPERMFESRNKQHWALSLQATFDTLTFLAVWLALAGTGTPLAAVQAYAAVQCLYHLTYLGVVCQLAELEIMQYLGLLALVAVLVATVIGLGWALSFAAIGVSAGFAIHAVAVAVFSLGALGRLRRT